MITNWLGYILLAGLVFTISPLQLPPSWSLDSDEEFRTLLWVNGQPFILNDLLPPDSGWTNLDPFVINDRGQLVGRGNLNGETRAFVITIRR